MSKLLFKRNFPAQEKRSRNKVFFFLFKWKLSGIRNHMSIEDITLSDNTIPDILICRSFRKLVVSVFIGKGCYKTKSLCAHITYVSVRCTCTERQIYFYGKCCHIIIITNLWASG